MFSLLKYSLGYLTNSTKSEHGGTPKKKTYQELFEEELAKLEETTPNDVINKEQTTTNELSDALKKDCFRKSGIITSLHTYYGIIDGDLQFDMGAVAVTNINLAVGQKVFYLAYKLSNDVPIKVVKIDQIEDGEWWDDECTKVVENVSESAPEYFGVHQRSILGIVSQKNESILLVDIDYKELAVDLDVVKSDFVPQIGDRIYMDCKVQSDNTFVDFSGEIVDVVHIYAGRKRDVNGTVTSITRTGGVINNEFFYTNDSIEENSRPKLGNRVSCVAIESDQGQYEWRCIKMSIVDSKQTNLPESTDLHVNYALMQNKFGITITDSIQFTFSKLGEHKTMILTVLNTSDKIHNIRRSYFRTKLIHSQLCLIKPTLMSSPTLAPGGKTEYTIKATASHYGRTNEVFVIVFESFSIGRTIQIDVDVQTEVDRSQRRPPRQDKTNSYEVWKNRPTDVIPGNRVTQKPRFIAIKFGSYDVPDCLRTVLLKSGDAKETMQKLEEIAPYMNESLSAKNYSKRMSTLIHMEEIDRYVLMRNFDMERAHFTHEKDFLALHVDNIGESRPSIVIGDVVRVTSPWSNVRECYEGCIHKVFQNKVLLKFNSKFHSNYKGDDYRVEFHFSRRSYVKQHYALNKVIESPNGESFLFPAQLTLNAEPQLNVSLSDDGELEVTTMHKVQTIKWFNDTLNNMQRIAICNILLGVARPMPYLIFGPPGTGKTMTLIELILQITTLISHSRIIVATPSNSSANLIAQRLIESDAFQPGIFVRLVGQNLIERENIPEFLLPYCATCDLAAEGTSKPDTVTMESGLKLRCQMKQIGRHRITIGTCATIGNLMQMNFRPGHFTHVIIDEAGQCLEPETLIPISLLDRNKGQIILAGDPMQLGPYVSDVLAKAKGFGVSFIARLLQHFPYLKDKNRFERGFDPRLVTKLIYNYRTLPSIMKPFNDLFYDSELLPMVSDTNSREIELFRSIRNVFPIDEGREVPSTHALFFVGVRGKNLQSPDSPSWYNASEAKEVFRLFIKLMMCKMTADDVGIITPYLQQKKVIQKVMIDAEILPPKIGTVEEFQGQERNIIIVSTVRSTLSLLQTDVLHSLGFVQSPKRLNVAISRAKSMLIIVGNPHLLVNDVNWCHLLKYSVLNNAYSGCDLPAKLLNNLHD